MEGELSFEDFINDFEDDPAWLEDVEINRLPAVHKFNFPNAPGDETCEEDATNEVIAGLEDEDEAAGSLTEASGREIPLPPPAQEYDSFDELFISLQAYYRNNGAAIIKKSPGNKANVNGTVIPTYYSIVCDRGASRASQSSGTRKATTSKVNCPFKITASASKKAN